MTSKLIKNVSRLGAFWIFSVFVVTSTAIPVDYETVTGLLPVEPQDLNETIAAVVVDPVVKDAVRQVAPNGSLNGLVVKRKVFIMPVNSPEQIISQRHQVLVVPPEHLEDVRRNITESTSEVSELDEFASAEKNPLFGGVAYSNESDADGVKYASDELRFDAEPQDESENTFSKNDDDTGNTDFTLLPGTTPAKESSEKVEVPIVAVINPANANGGKVASPIVAVLPNQVDGQVLKTEVHFLNNQQGLIQKDAQAYVNQNSITIDPDARKVTSSSAEIERIGQPEEEYSTDWNSKSEGTKLYLTTVVVPPVEIVSSLVAKDNEYPRGLEDMDVAEDIVFRPLFRYRQEAAQRAKIQAENFYRRTNYRRRRPYDDYDDSYSQQKYRQRPRYDYDYN